MARGKRKSELASIWVATGGVPSHVEKEKWRILPVDAVHDQPAAW